MDRPNCNYPEMLETSYGNSEYVIYYCGSCEFETRSKAEMSEPPDPEPWKLSTFYYGSLRFSYEADGSVFDPRPEYNQNPKAYGVDIPAWGD